MNSPTDGTDLVSTHDRSGSAAATASPVPPLAPARGQPDPAGARARVVVGRRGGRGGPASPSPGGLRLVARRPDAIVRARRDDRRTSRQRRAGRLRRLHDRGLRRVRPPPRPAPRLRPVVLVPDPCGCRRRRPARRSPPTVSRADAVFNVAHAALLVEALTRDPSLLGVALAGPAASGRPAGARPGRCVRCSSTLRARRDPRLRVRGRAHACWRSNRTHARCPIPARAGRCSGPVSAPPGFEVVGRGLMP